MTWTLTALGTGSAFTLYNFQTSFLLTHRNALAPKQFLLDCGSDVRFGLKELGLSYKDIDATYVSHLHADHIGGLEWLGFSKYFDPTQDRPGLYVHTEVREGLWSKTLSGGMESIQGHVVGLSDYFAIREIQQNESDEWKGIVIQPVQMSHVMNGYSLMPCYGLLLSSPNARRAGEKLLTVFITTDTQFAPQLNDFYEMADVIIHDCESLYMPDGTPIKSGVHAHYEDLKTLPDEVKAKMWLTHYQDGAPERHDAVKDGFLGFLQRGQVLEFN